MIFPIILAGGSGTRLWPLSRKSYPKQFSKILGNNTLFQERALHLGGSNKLGYQNPIILTNDEFRFIITEQLDSIGIEPGAILIEPEAKNTAPAILAAALFLANKSSDATPRPSYPRSTCWSSSTCLSRSRSTFVQSPTTTFCPISSSAGLRQ